MTEITQATRNAMLELLLLKIISEAGGELSCLDVAILATAQDDRDPLQLCADFGYEPDDIIRITPKGMTKLQAGTP